MLTEWGHPAWFVQGGQGRSFGDEEQRVFCDGAKEAGLFVGTLSSQPKGCTPTEILDRLQLLLLKDTKTFPGSRNSSYLAQKDS